MYLDSNLHEFAPNGPFDANAALKQVNSLSPKM